MSCCPQRNVGQAPLPTKVSALRVGAFDPTPAAEKLPLYFAAASKMEADKAAARAEAAAAEAAAESEANGGEGEGGDGGGEGEGDKWAWG